MEELAFSTISINRKLVRLDGLVVVTTMFAGILLVIGLLQASLQTVQTVGISNGATMAADDREVGRNAGLPVAPLLQAIWVTYLVLYSPTAEVTYGDVKGLQSDDHVQEVETFYNAWKGRRRGFEVVAVVATKAWWSPPWDALSFDLCAAYRELRPTAAALDDRAAEPVATRTSPSPVDPSTGPFYQPRLSSAADVQGDPSPPLRRLLHPSPMPRSTDIEPAATRSGVVEMAMTRGKSRGIVGAQ
ncbi:hypothetical protein E2562_007350 [Oryza meyeriana var. granulata]|uniref:DUF4220 domain-containing protein n=1 Tax=Oryza meyeriana var. granulata TaxID=110450 RepID=A0A6G1D1D0_9ORYZ|nr:hypothetical protein E2562_007350 [Oryza meyeriana var. granulata]